MGWFNFTSIVSVLFTAWLAQNIYTLSAFWRTHECVEPTTNSEKHCFTPYFRKKYSFTLQVSTCATSCLKQTILQKSFVQTESWKEEIEFDLPAATIKNGSLYYLTSFQLIPPHPNQKAIKQTLRLSKWQIPRRFQNLLKENEEKQKLYTTPGSKPVTHIPSSIGFVSPVDLFPLDVKLWPNELRATFLPSKEYLPPFDFDILRSRHEQRLEVLPTNTTTKLTVEYNTQSLGTYRFMRTMGLSLEQMKENFGFQDKDIDEVKSLLADTGMKMLALTFFISAFHLLFDFLAFRADIVHWKSIKSFVGISSSTIQWRAFSTVIIFAHLYGEDTSYLILFPMGFSMVIELWKVSKASRFSFKLKFWDKDGVETADEAATTELDAQGIKYLSYILWPLCICGAIYSLVYLEHKSWTQWCLSSVVNGVYGFGFVFMLPQLFINYKLKSVAHLPWRAFMYKAFNTFIDDVFAFLIKMPTSHRIACFRDDIVFFCYLYQLYLYPVDYSRVNEFGQTGDDQDDKEKETKKTQ